MSNYRAVERQLQIMKQMGVNAIRSTHNPASEELHEACDRLGLLMVEEGFDCWGVERGKKAYDYGRFFSRPVPDCRARVPAARAGETWAEYDLAAMVARPTMMTERRFASASVMRESLISSDMDILTPCTARVCRRHTDC